MADYVVHSTNGMVLIQINLQNENNIKNDKCINYKSHFLE